MGIFGRIDTFITWFDGVVWGLPLIILILVTGIFLTVRLGLLQVRYLGKALKFMVKNEEDGHGEVTSFGALCTALSATIGTGNIVGVATAISAGGPGALFWMILTAFLGMATKYSEGLLAVKYRTIDEDGHVLGGPFYYIENGMGVKFRWLAKIFAFHLIQPFRHIPSVPDRILQLPMNNHFQIMLLYAPCPDQKSYGLQMRYHSPV